MIRKRWMVVLLLTGIAAGFAFTALAAPEDIPRMTRDELKGMMQNPDMVILDVRVGKDWDASEFKIKGAVRTDPAKLDAWKDKFGKEKTLVLYCA